MHVLNPGEREYLSPNLIGVQNIAMTFLPLSMNFINIIDAFREIVNGVRYEIVLNAVNTEDNNADIVCRLVILEKPWLRTNWGDKVRELQHSNCTATEEDGVANTTPLPGNMVNDKYVKSTAFNGGSRNELTDGEMKRLEDQIFSSAISYKRMPSNKFVIPSTSTTKSITANADNVADEQEVAETTTITSNIDEESAADNKNYANGQKSDETETVTDGTALVNNEKTVVDEEATATELPQQEITSTTTGVPELSADEMKWLDDIFSVGAFNFESNLNSVPSLGGGGSSGSGGESGQPDNLQQQEQVIFFLILFLGKKQDTTPITIIIAVIVSVSLRLSFVSSSKLLLLLSWLLFVYFFSFFIFVLRKIFINYSLVAHYLVVV